jgi:hypothetical protein
MKHWVGSVLSIAVAVVLGASAPAGASPPVTADSGLPVADSTVDTIATSGNTTFIGGEFDAIGPRTGAMLEFHASTGANVATPQVNGGGIDSMVPDGSGGWYIGGDFDRVNGAVRYGLAHELGNGTVDPNFPQLSHQPLSADNHNDAVASLALSSDGKTLYVGGFFVSLGGVARQSIAAVSTATDAVTSWAPQLKGTSPDVSHIVLGAGTTIGSVFIGGNFTGVGSVSTTDLAKLSTSTGGADLLFAPDPTGSPTVSLSALALSSTGSALYVGGTFTHIGGTARNDLARVATTGASEGDTEAWDPEPDGIVSTIVVSASVGSIFVGGLFEHVGGVARNGLAALNSSNGDATSWNPGLSAASDVAQLSLDGSDLLVLGELGIGGGTRSVAVIDLTSAAVGSFDPSFNGEVLTAAAAGDEVVLGGVDLTTNASARSDLAALDPYGRLQSFAPTFTGEFGSAVTALAISPDGKTLYVGGGFTAADGQPRDDVAAFDIATGALTAWRADVPDGIVNALSLSADGKTLYVGGLFDHLGADDQARKDVGAVSTATGDATAWSPGFTGTAVSTLALSHDSGTVYVGGAFSSLGGQPRTNLAALSASGTGAATAWAPNPHGGGFTPEVNSLAVGADGTVYVGGTFATIGSNALARPNLAAISPAGTGAATGWNPTVTTTDSANAAAVRALALSADGATLFVGGRFDQLGGQPRIDLGEVSLASGAATTWNPDPGPYFGQVSALSNSGATLRAGGGFERIGNDGDQDYAQFTSLPVNTARPKLSGKASYHKTLTCHPGTFSNSPLAITYAWTRAGKPIAHQTGTSYRVQGSDSGHALACLVTAVNARGSAVASSTSVTPGPYIGSFSLKRKKGHRYFKFSLSERAKVTITIYRLKHGHKGHKGRKVGAITGKVGAGNRKLVLSAKVGRRHLSAGRYEATITARDAGRRRSNSRTLKLSVT